jgi:hypothetical protein
MTSPSGTLDEKGMMADWVVQIVVDIVDSVSSRQALGSSTLEK